MRLKITLNFLIRFLSPIKTHNFESFVSEAIIATISILLEFGLYFSEIRMKQKINKKDKRILMWVDSMIKILILMM